MKKRIIGIIILFAGLFFLLLCRMVYLQLIEGPSLAKSASTQRMTKTSIDKPRGNILDKNGIALTARNKSFMIVLQPLLLNGRDIELQRLTELLGQDFIELRRVMEIKKEPVIFKPADNLSKDDVLRLKIPGVSIIQYYQRYDEKTVAKHLMGYLNQVDQIGKSGLEKAYEDYLKINGKSSIGAVLDAQDGYLRGAGYRLVKAVDKIKSQNVMLTIDYHIQRIVEDVMTKHGITGSVVVEDVCTGDIAAICSKPDFNPNKVEDYLDSPKKELFNRALASYNLGSIFKIIDVALSYELGKEPEENFYCTGYITVGGQNFNCLTYDRGGHGWLDLTSAFSLSCNPYFINMGIQNGYKETINMAEKFGLGKVSGLTKQGITETKGNLPDLNRFYSNGDIANMSIGQGDVLATPLQVADLVATIANGGIKNTVNLVDSIVDENGKVIKKIKKSEGHRILKKETSDKVRELMVEVVKSGTGKGIDLEAYGGAGGKTASAETGQFVDGDVYGENIVHGWFAGYFPRLNPKYSIAVFAENGKKGGETAGPIFKEIAEEILKRKL